MLVNPFRGPSTTYITVPSRITTMTTVEMKMKIFRPLALRARPRVRYSRMKAVSFRMRNTRSSRRIRTSISTWRPGTRNAR